MRHSSGGHVDSSAAFSGCPLPSVLRTSSLQGLRGNAQSVLRGKLRGQDVELPLVFPGMTLVLGQCCCFVSIRRSLVLTV